MQIETNRRSFILSTLALPALYQLDNTGLGQETGSSSSALSNQVLALARSAFLSSRDDFSYDNSADSAWFHDGLNPISEVNQDLTVVASDVRLSSTFDVARLASPGDIVRIRWENHGKSTSMILVYAGQEQFPDESRPRSFFIFPYRFGLEYNTIPTRRHADGVSRFNFGSIAPIDPEVENLFRQYLPEDADRGNRRWASGPNAYDNGTSLVNGTARATIFRVKRLPNLPGDTFQLAINDGDYRPGDVLSANVSSAGPVGIESDFRRQSWEDRGRGHRQVDLGRVSKPGTYFVHAFAAQQHRVAYVAVLPVAANTLRVQSLPLPHRAFEDLALGALENKYFELLQANGWAYFRQALSNVTPEFLAKNLIGAGELLLGVGIVVLTGGLGAVLGAATKGSALMLELVVSTCSEAARLMVNDQQMFEDDARRIADKINAVGTFGSMIASATSLSGVAKWKQLSNVDRWGHFATAIETSANVTNEFVADGDGHEGAIVTKVIADGAAVLDKTKIILRLRGK